MTRSLTTIAVALTVSLLASTVQADDYDLLKGQLAKDPNTIQTLKNGQKAQNTRHATQLNQLDSKTQKTLLGRGDDAQNVKHNGEKAKAKRDLNKLQANEAKEAKKSKKVSSNAKRATASKNSKDLNKAIKKGEVAQAKRSKGIAASSSKAAKTGSKVKSGGKGLKVASKTAKSTKTVAKTAKTAKTAAKVGKTAKKLKTVGKVAAGGVLAMGAGVALGVDVPDVFDAAAFSYDLAKDPRNADKKIAGLATGATAMGVTALNAATDPSKMASNIANAAKGAAHSIANTGVYKKLAKTKTGKAIGSVATASYKVAAAGYSSFQKSKTGKATATAAKAVNKAIFKPANKLVNKAAPVVTKTVAKTTEKVRTTVRNTVKDTTKKVSTAAKKSSKKVAKKAKASWKKIKKLF